MDEEAQQVFGDPTPEYIKSVEEAIRRGFPLSVVDEVGGATGTVLDIPADLNSDEQQSVRKVAMYLWWHSYLRGGVYEDFGNRTRAFYLYDLDRWSEENT